MTRLRVLQIQASSKYATIPSANFPDALVAALAVVKHHVEVIEIVGIPTGALVHLVSPTTRHLVVEEHECRRTIRPSPKIAAHKLRTDDKARLDSLTLYRTYPHDPAPLPCLRYVSISQLRALLFGLWPQVESSRSTLSGILKECCETLEELRLTPSYGSGGSANVAEFLTSSDCPPLAAFPRLKHFEIALPWIGYSLQPFVCAERASDAFEGLARWLHFPPWDSKPSSLETVTTMFYMSLRRRPRSNGPIVRQHRLDTALCTPNMSNFKKLIIVVHAGQHNTHASELAADVASLCLADTLMTEGRVDILDMKDYRRVQDTGAWTPAGNEM